MGIFTPRLHTIYELKRTVNGQEEDLDEDETEGQEVGGEVEPTSEPEINNDEPTEGDDTQDPEEGDPNDYSMDTGNDSTEPEDDNTNTQDPEEGDNTEYSMEDDTEGEEGGEQPADGEEQEPSEPTEGDDTQDPEEGDNTEYSMEDDDTEGEEGGEQPADGEEQEPSEPSDNTDTQEPSEDDLKQIENELFKDLPEQQMQIKNEELKQQYLEVYTATCSILVRTNNIVKTNLNMKVLEFIIEKLIQLKELVQTYLTTVYDTKTYVENTINYQQYLATLNTINRLFKEITPKKQE